MKAQQIQSELYNLENCLSYHEQHFTTQTQKKITVEQWQQINLFIQDVVDVMSGGINVELFKQQKK
jgi:flagellar biosynthesis chaperone FliJ